MKEAPYTPVPWPDDPEDDDAPDFTWQGNYNRAKECVEACEGMAFPLTEIITLRAQFDELRRALKAVTCGCSIRERNSGHRLDCWMPQVDAVLTKTEP